MITSSIHRWKMLLTFVTLAVVSVFVQKIHSLPIAYPESTTTSSVIPESNILRTPIPAMVPVSSTVISVVREPIAARHSSSNHYFTRRFRFFDKSSKPDEPIRLITKSSRLKALMEAAKTS